MNTEHKKTVRSKVAVNMAVYVWAFALLLVAPAFQWSPLVRGVIFHVYLFAALMMVAWPAYIGLRYGTPHEPN